MSGANVASSAARISATPPPPSVTFNNTSGSFSLVTFEASCPSSAPVSAYVNGSGTNNSFSNGGNVVRPTITGGQAPLSYSWTKTSGDGTVSAGGTTLVPTITFTGVPNGGAKSGVYRLTVTDALSRAASADVSLTGQFQCTE
jgi:hypothetical protein